MTTYPETTQEEKVTLALRLIVAGYVPTDISASFGLCHHLFQLAEYNPVELSIERLDLVYSDFEYYSGGVYYPVASPDYDCPRTAYDESTQMYGEGEYARRRRELAQHLINYITFHGLPPIV